MTGILTAEHLAAIRGRAGAATPGPWELFQPGQCCRDGYCIDGLHSLDLRHADAVFVAGARADVPALLAHIDALTALTAQRDRQLALAGVTPAMVRDAASDTDLAGLLAGALNFDDADDGTWVVELIRSAGWDRADRAIPLRAWQERCDRLTAELAAYRVAGYVAATRSVIGEREVVLSTLIADSPQAARAYHRLDDLPSVQVYALVPVTE